MAGKRVDIDIKTTADTSGVKATSQAIDGVTESAKKAKKATSEIADESGMQEAAKQSGAFASKVQNAGFQIADFAVQVNGGTDAVRALGQQLPQLLGSFGAWGAVLSAVAAILTPMVGKVFELAKGAQSSSEEMEKLKTVTEGLGEKMAETLDKEIKRRLENFKQKSDIIQEEERITRQAETNMIEIRNQRAESEQRVVDAQRETTKAALDYLIKTGQIKDAEMMLEEQRKQIAEEKANAEKRAAQALYETEQAKYAAILQERKNAEDDAAAARKQIDELNLQMEAAKKTLAESLKRDKFAVKELGAGKGYESPATLQLKEQIKLITGQMDGLYEVVSSLPTNIEKISAKAYEQSIVVQNAMETAEQQVREIDSKFALSEKAEQLKQATGDMEALAKDLADNIGKLQPINEAQRQAQQAILEAIKGGITPEEQQAIAYALKTLMSTLQANQNTTLQTMRELISANASYGNQMAALRNDVESLKRQANKITTTQPQR